MPTATPRRPAVPHRLLLLAALATLARINHGELRWRAKWCQSSSLG